MTWLTEPVLAAAIGVISALLPIVNAEAYALLAAVRMNVAQTVVIVIALASGQTVGKLALFQVARRGSGRLHARLSRRGESRAGRWQHRVCGLMARRRTGVLTVLASATVGLRPLALVSLVAGASTQQRWEFGAVCLIGRSARFAAITPPAVYAAS